ncbi:hypothetical protein Dsin_008531 [Dipteronia sinensis]|uniref:RNase H type-1 domain-containing protein n=1 Tax=Dipteronia sinensis TaxID=43782 RepID=A0AAE0ANW5_9ROSI|nr:hypothetical protein Dsin_008531 [Dipteronia sinensis]
MASQDPVEGKALHLEGLLPLVTDRSLPCCSWIENRDCLPCVQRTAQVADVKWDRPEVGVFKVNTDAAINNVHKTLGIGLIVRNHEGLVMGFDPTYRCYLPSSSC